MTCVHEKSSGNWHSDVMFAFVPKVRFSYNTLKFLELDKHFLIQMNSTTSKASTRKSRWLCRNLKQGGGGTRKTINSDFESNNSPTNTKIDVVLVTSITWKRPKVVVDFFVSETDFIRILVQTACCHFIWTLKYRSIFLFLFLWAVLRLSFCQWAFVR